MATNPNVGAETGSGAEAQPEQPVSPQAQPPIESEATKLLAGFGEKFDALQKELRGLQGRQDRAENNFQSQLAKFNQIKSQGNLSDDQAMEVMQKGDAEAQRWTNLEKKLDDLAGRFAGVGTQANEQQTVTKVFETVGLDPKDPRVAAALVKKYDSPDAVELAAYRLQRELAASPSPIPSQGTSLTGGGSANSAAALDAVYRQYEVAFKEPTKNAALLANLEKQMKDLGG